MEDIYRYKGVDHESIVTSSSSTTHHTHPSSVSTVSVRKPSILKEEAEILSLSSPSPSMPTASPVGGSVQNFSIPSYHMLYGGHPTTKSPMSKACLSSMIPEFQPEGYGHTKEMFTERPMCPDPPKHKSPTQEDVTDKSFMGVVSAINAMNASMNASRLSNINLASALETYAAVIHSRNNLSFSIESDMNEARANCFDHAAVFWMEWATVQANLQLSLMQDLFRLKNLADNSIAHGCDSNAEILDADSIRTMVVKLTKLSHDSFNQAYKQGSDWSSVGGLNYWVAQLPEPVMQDAPTIIPTSDHSSTPPRSVANTSDLLIATEATIAEQVSLRKKRNDEDLRLSNKFSGVNLNSQLKDEPEGVNNTSDIPSSFQYLPGGPESIDPSSNTDLKKIDEVFRRNNERTVHSFRYPNGQKGTNSDGYQAMEFSSVLPQSILSESMENRAQHLTRSHKITNFCDDLYSDVTKDISNQSRNQKFEEGLAEDNLEKLKLLGKFRKTLNKDISSYKMNCGGNRDKSAENGIIDTQYQLSANKQTSSHDYKKPPYNPISLSTSRADNNHISGIRGIGNTNNQSTTALCDSIENLPISNDTSFSEYITNIDTNTAYQNSDSSLSQTGELIDETFTQDLSWDDQETDIISTEFDDPYKETTSWEALDEFPSGSYLAHPLPYAITEEDPSNKTTPPKKKPSNLGMGVGCTTPPKSENSTETTRPGNIRRKGKFEKRNGAIKMVIPHKAENSSSEDDGVKGGATHNTGGDDQFYGSRYYVEAIKKSPITTISGVQHDMVEKLQHAETKFFDEVKPLEPNLNLPNQYPSRGYFSEDLQREPIESILGIVDNLAQDKKNFHSRWSNHLKKMMNYIPRRDESASPTPMGPKSKGPMNPDPKYTRS